MLTLSSDNLPKPLRFPSYVSPGCLEPSPCCSSSIYKVKLDRIPRQTWPGGSQWCTEWMWWWAVDGMSTDRDEWSPTRLVAYENKREQAQACDAKPSIAREKRLRLQNTKQMKRCIIFQGILAISNCLQARLSTTIVISWYLLACAILGAWDLPRLMYKVLAVYINYAILTEKD